MTRINVVPVEELSDQWLVAEYRELPRVLKQKIDISDAPEEYCLGKGHMKWARKHWAYCAIRYYNIVHELQYRGIKITYRKAPLDNIDTNTYGYYAADPVDFKLNQQRLIEKYKLKPDWYRWTNRNKPKWLEV